MPPPRPLVITYRLAVARNAKTEPEFFPTLTAVHPAGGLTSGSGPDPAADVLALGLEAIRNLDPELDRYVITVKGGPETGEDAGSRAGQTPVWQKHGWAIYLDWETP